MTKAIVALPNFGNMPKNIPSYFNNNMRFGFSQERKNFGLFPTVYKISVPKTLQNIFLP
jgi:hypothetical protein